MLRGFGLADVGIPPIVSQKIQVRELRLLVELHCTMCVGVTILVVFVLYVHLNRTPSMKYGE